MRSEMLHVRAGGNRLRVKRLFLEGKRPLVARPVLVFLHEGLGCIEHWRDFPDSLCETVEMDGLIYDRRGYGGSGIPEERWPADYLLDEAGRVLPEVLKAAGVDDAVLVGHSDGGSIALLAADVAGESIRGIVTEAAHIFVEEETVRGIAEFMEEYEKGGIREKLARFHGENTDAVVRRWANTWLAGDFRNWNIESHLPQISCPVFAIQGENDEYATKRQVQGIVKGVSGEVCWEIVPDCGHAPHVQARQRVTASMARFIESLCRSSCHLRRIEGQWQANCRFISRSRAMSEKKTKILVVDDDLFFRKMLPKKLGAEKFLFEEAENGTVALDKLYADPDIGLVVSDMEMPEMNGMELIERIRKSGNDVPLIVMTATDQVTVAIEAMKIGANDYLIKDENILRTLSISVDRVLDKHRLKECNRKLLSDLAAKNEELEKSNRELRELNDLKNKFLGIAAHDLRNPLSSIRGLSEFLLNEIFGPLNDEQKEYLGVINTTSNDMLFLVNDLLDVSVIERGRLEIKPAMGALTEMIGSRLKINRMSAEKKNMEIVWEAGDLPELEFDPQRVAQVFDNLFSNAVKFSPPGSKILVALKSDGDMATVSISDQGPGISEEERSRLFGEFQKLSAKPTAGEHSTGLGLAIVKKIVDAHGGALEVESDVGQGSTFSFKLPIR